MIQFIDFYVHPTKKMFSYSVSNVNKLEAMVIKQQQQLDLDFFTQACVIWPV